MQESSEINKEDPEIIAYLLEELSDTFYNAFFEISTKRMKYDMRLPGNISIELRSIATELSRDKSLNFKAIFINDSIVYLRDFYWGDNSDMTVLINETYSPATRIALSRLTEFLTKYNVRIK